MPFHECLSENEDKLTTHALYLRSVCAITNAFYGLRCHPLTCISLKLRLSVDSNPTLSAMLFKINNLLESFNPLSGTYIVLGMSDIQFCKAPVRAVKAKTD